MHRLLRRAALAVDGGARHVVGKTGDEPARARDVAGLGSDGVDTAEHDVVDCGGIDVDAGHQGPDRVRAEIGRVHSREGSAPAPDGAAHCVDDVGLGHRELLVVVFYRIARATRSW